MTARRHTDMHVAVIGGGVVGATTTLELARRGTDVTLFDAGDVADGASGRAAGICYDAFADSIDADIAREALSAFRKRGSLTACPYVWLTREGDDRNAEAMAEHVPRMQEQGLDVEFIDPADLESRWPQLRVDDVERAAIAHDAGFVETSNYTRETAQFAVAAGANLRTKTRASLDSSGRVDGEEYDAVVVAAGAHTADLLEAAGYPVPVKAYRVQAYLSTKTALANVVPMLYDATGSYYLRPRNGRLFVGDGTVPEEHDPSDWKQTADEWFVENCAAYLETALGKSVGEHRSWAGLCTATPDGNPLVGERAPGIYVAAGFQGHGFMRAPAIGKRLAAEVLGGDGIDAFDPTRFDGDETFDIVEGMSLEE
ncbi:MAG: sarcosine oxidase subunit beta [Natronomonas sp.]|jgi:sarcosine oxidase subunit beta|uniref:NAD(P)/FAD-dependent oxidoreductase n=1 Tax=Natronomonas sp. TaxID=2184060 RepID=UPI0039896426